jgi:hypothetical protein
LPRKERPDEAATTKKKKQTPRLAASVPRRAPFMKAAKCPFAEISRGPMPEANTEEGLVSFEGFIPECSPIRDPIVLPAFSLVDKSDSEGSPSSSRSYTEEVNLGDTGAASPLSETAINENDHSPATGTNEPTRPRVKHMAKRRKFGPRDRLAGII